MAVTIIKLGEKKSDADLEAEAQDKQDEEIEKAIAYAFESTDEHLTVERINNLKNILNDIVDAQKKSKENKLTFVLKEALEFAIKKRKIVIVKKELEELLRILNAEVKNDDVVSVVEVKRDEVKEVKDNQEVEVANLGTTIVLSKQLIHGIDKILEENKRKNIRSNLVSEDEKVTADFAVGVRTILDNEENTSGVKVNKYATSGAVVVGGACLGTGIHFIVVAGSIVAAGVFPIGLAVVGGILIIGAGIYYAKKKRERIAKFLPALYAKSKNTKDMRIEQLDGEERHKKLESLTRKHDKNNQKNKDLVEKEIARYKKKHQGKYDRICSKIQDSEEELKEIQEMLKDPTVDFQEFKKTHKSRLSKVNVDVKTVKDLESLKQKLRSREGVVRFGRLGDVEETLKKVHDMYLSVDDYTNFDEFKKKYALEHANNFEGFKDFTDLKSFKAHLKQIGFYYSTARTGSLVQLNESKIDWERDQEAFKQNRYASLEAQNKENAAKYKKNSSLIENKLIKLRWYKKIVPYFAYWATNVAINFRSNAVALREFTAVVEAGAAQASKTLEEKGSDPGSLSEFQEVEKIAKNIEDAREQFEARVGKFVALLSKELPDQNRTDFYDYLKIEECYVSDTIFQKKIARLVSGDKIKNTMLRIFYTHPSTVLSVLDVHDEKTIDNINAVLKDAERHLSNFSVEVDCLNSMQVYFPPDNNSDYKRFMLVSNENPEDAKAQEEFFEHILVIKKSIMEVNKTLQAVPKEPPEELNRIKKGINDKIESLITSAKLAVDNIEEQLAKLDIVEESNKYREAYLRIFSDFSEANGLDGCIKRARFSDAILILDADQIKQFAESFEGRQLEDGILKEFYERFSKLPLMLKEERFNFFQKAQAAGAEDLKQLEMLQKEYENFFEDRSFGITKLQKLNGQKIVGKEDLEQYVKNNEHIYRSQRVLIDQKRGVLEEMQKSLVLSMPEIETTLGLPSTHKFKRIAKKRRVNYGIPYNPSMSLSMDYISNLFKSTQLAFRTMKGMLFKLKFPEMTISSINLNLGEILNVVSDERIPGSIENALKFLNKIKGIRFPGFDFDVTFGSLFDTMQKDTAVLNRDNQKKVVDAIKGLQKFLGNIPWPFSEMTFPDLILEIRKMSLEIGKLSIRLAQLNPFNVNDALEMKNIILKLKTLKTNFNKLNIELGKIDLKSLVRDLPDRFPCKAALSDFVVKFDPFFEGLKSMSLEFDKINVGKFPWEDFLYICNCYPEFKKFGGFGNLVIQFPEWLKQYAELENKIKKLEGEEAGWNPFSSLGDYKIQLGEIKINLEKFRKFKMCLGTVAKFSLETPSFQIPEFLALPELSGISLGSLRSLSKTLDTFGDISFDDMSFVINFLGEFGGVEGLALNLKNLRKLMLDLTLHINSLKKLSEEDLEKLKNDLKEATRKFEMFEKFSLKFEKLSFILPKPPGLPAIDASMLSSALEGIKVGLSGINLSIDLYSGMNNVKNAFSKFDLKFNIKSLWPSFPEAEKKNKTNKENSSLNFDLDFGNVDLKAIDLDEIIKRVEQLRDLNNETKTQLDEALKNPIAENVRQATGLGSAQEKEFTDKVNATYAEVKKGLDVTLLSLYTLRATIAIINAIKRGDGTAVVAELEELAKKAFGLQSEIKLIVDELNMLKEFGSTSELEKIELLKKKLASKEQDLKNVKLNLFELKRMREAFLDSNITVDYNKPPISDMMSGIEPETVKVIINQAKIAIVEAGKLSSTQIDSAVIAVELSEITLKLVPLVDIMQNRDRKNIKSEVEELIKEASAPLEDVDPEIKLLKLNDIKKRLLEFKQLTERASEIPSVDFAKSPYSNVLQSLGLSGDMVKSFVENANKISREDIDGALRKLAIAELPFKLALLEKNMVVITKAKPLLDFLKERMSAGDSNPDDIIAMWSKNNKSGESLNFFELRDAVESAKSLLNEVQQLSLGGEIKGEAEGLLFKLKKIKTALNGMLENTDEQKAKHLFSSICDFANAAAIVEVGAKVDALRRALTMDATDFAKNVALPPGAIIEERKKTIGEFVKHTEGLMRKFEAYRRLVQISNELKNKKLEDIDSKKFKDFEALYSEVMGSGVEKKLGLEDDIETFLKFKKHFHDEWPIIPSLESKNDNALVMLLGVLDNLYSLNGAQDIHQKLESVESFFQVLKAREVQKSIVHPSVLTLSGGPQNTPQTEAEPKPEDLTQKKSGPPPPLPPP